MKGYSLNLARIIFTSGSQTHLVSPEDILREKSAFSYLRLSFSVHGTYYACHNLLNSTMKTEINCGNKLKMTKVFIIQMQNFVFVWRRKFILWNKIC
jgi:hypothetical protein